MPVIFFLKEKKPFLGLIVKKKSGSLSFLLLLSPWMLITKRKESVKQTEKIQKQLFFLYWIMMMMMIRT